MKSGIDYFPLDVSLDSKFELVEAEFGLLGFAVVVKLYQRIFGSEGYYCEWTTEVALLFAKHIGLGGNAVSEILSAAIKRGIFDSNLFEKYQVLTSRGIQKRYFDIVKRRKDLQVKKEYLLVDPTQICKDVNILSENVNISIENADIPKQSKVKESKVKESKEKDIGASKSPRFVPPSLLEVAVYCKERHNNIHPEEFLDFYTANGWKQGKGKQIVDWKACMRTWEKDQRRQLSKIVLPSRGWTEEKEARPVRRCNKNWEGVV